MISLCNNWEFIDRWQDDFASGALSGEAVRLPHTVKELPLHYADHRSYEMLCGYRRSLTVTEEMLGKRLFLQFDGAGHIATVYVNGCEAGHHRTGYTAFRVEITGLVHAGDNLIAVKLDASENPEVPPFGFVIDYLTYGGLYREVWLDVREKSFISDLYITTPTTESLRLEITAENAENACFKVEILTEEGERLLKKKTLDTCVELELPGVRSWSCEDPCRHICRRHYLSVAVAHRLNVDALVIGGGIAVIRPKKGAYLHFLSGLLKLCDTVGSNLNDLPGTKLLFVNVSQLLISEGLKCDAVAVISLSDQHRQSAKPVAGGDQRAVILKNKN